MRVFKTKALFFLLVPVLACAVVGRAQADPFASGQSIDTRMDLGLFGLLGGGMNYSMGGRPLTRYADFKGLIYPLRDEEASDLIRDAEQCHFAASVLYVTGGVVGVDVALNFKPVPFLGVDWFDRISTAVVAGEFFWGAGALLDNGAEGRKYNAVQRYNQLLRNSPQAVLELKPRLALAPQGPELGLDLAF